MNLWIAMGRLTADPEVRYTQGDNSKPVARYRLAVDRRRANADGTRDADFINCVAFDRQAEFAERYLHKGTKVVVTGEIRTGSYTNRDGNKVYTTEAFISTQEFAESKSVSQQNGGYAQAQYTGGQSVATNEGFEPVEDQFEALFGQR